MPFLPKTFDPPKLLETEHLRLRPITIHDVVKDYDAVMTSREHLWEMFGEVWGWPPETLTLEEDLVDLARHQKEGEIKSSFNYAVMSLDGKRLLGCVYIDPSDKAGAEAAFWVTAGFVRNDPHETRASQHFSQPAFRFLLLLRS